MPKRVIVTTVWTCSLCDGETDQEKITPYKLNGGGARLTFDVCATCKDSGPFASLLAAGLSERVAGSGKKSKAVDDDLTCDRCASTFATPAGLAQHKARKHGVQSTTAAIMASRGKTGAFVCPECKFRAKNGQGLAAHRRVAHAG